jgi:carbonic anhydrase
MRAHYPSEHKFNNVMADLEIQLFHTDLLHLSLACSSKKAAIVLMFNLNSTNDNNGFFDDFTTKTPTPGGDSGSMDISKLLDLASSMKSNISGYVGTDTMPPCTRGVCYYVYEKIFSITQAQLDYFKVKNINYNARQANQGLGE